MSAKTAKPKPQLKNLDDLFALDGEAAQGKAKIQELPIAELVPFEGHPFRLYEGERLEDMVESVRANGVLAPIIARRKAAGGAIEILAGHNRVNAAKMAGQETVPAIVLENISDEEAMVYVVETNVMQRSFADMAHSEKAAVVAMRHGKMFSQGKRNDILERLKMLENIQEKTPKNPHENGGNATSPQVGAKLRTDEKIGEIYSLSKNTIARYLRVQHLIPALKARLDKDEIAFMPAVTLSFLKEQEQELVDGCMERNNLRVDMKKSDMLRQHSEKGKLDGESVRKILTGDAAPKPNRAPTVKISKTVYARYFGPGQPAKEVQATVEKALEMYFGSGGGTEK